MSAHAQFTVTFDGPLDFAASLEGFRRSGDDLIDRWDGQWLTRTMRIAGDPVGYACRPSGTLDAPALSVIVENPTHADLIKHPVAQSFAHLSPAFDALRNDDPVIGRLAKLHHGFRPPLHPDLLVALIRCISAQQVNLRWAATTRRRLAEHCGRRHEFAGQMVYSLDPGRLARLEVAAIRALQFTTRKAEYIINVARAIAEGGLAIDSLTALPDDEVIARITAIKGLGLWSAEWILARTLGRPRVSAGDLGVRKAIGIAYFGGRMPSPAEVREATSHWGDAAALAQELLLHAQHLKSLEGAVTWIPAP